MKTTHLLPSALLGLAALLGAPAAHAVKVPLVTFFNASIGDHFSTTNPVWTCHYFHTTPCAGTLGGYVPVGVQGHVWSPSDPQPSGTVRLFHWFSEARGDNFLTTDPRWAGMVGDHRFSGADYVLTRIEGFVPTTGPFYLELKSYWNGAVEDNAALATWRFAPPSGYTQYRSEGFLLPPDSPALARCGSNAAPNLTDPTAWQARGNYVDTWVTSNFFLSGDTIRLTAPADWYRVDFWGHQYPVRGYSFSHADGSYPVPGEPPYALLARVTAGRAYVAGRGWYDANQWFKALGDQDDQPGMCVLFDGTGVTPNTTHVQTMFNDPNIGDNGGWANVRVQQWF